MSALEGSVFQEQGMRAGTIKPPPSRQLECIYDEHVWIVTQTSPDGLRGMWAFDKEITATEYKKKMSAVSYYLWDVHKLVINRK